MNEVKQNELTDALSVAAEAGHVLLENGAEIARVEDTMETISSHFGAHDKNFFVLSNGIFTTGSNGREQYAKAESIPMKGIQMAKIVEINNLSREVASGKYTLEQTREKIREIHHMAPKRAWVQILGSAFGSAGFCIIFGGGFLDAAASFVVGFLLWAFVLLISRPHVSKFLVSLLGATFAAVLCMLFESIGFGEQLGNMIIGSVIPLIPGVAFINGIRDIANEDYIAGITRLLDAMFVFLGIAIGVCITFIVHAHIHSDIISLSGTLANPGTANLIVQTLAAFIGTIGFAVLFGVPSRYYISTGVIAAIGWAVYFLIAVNSSLSTVENTFITAIFVSIISRYAAVIYKCPVTVFLICGLFPLIPGGGVFWTTYYITSHQLNMALTSGMTALFISVAIVIAMVIISAIPQYCFSFRKSKYKSYRDK